MGYEYLRYVALGDSQSEGLNDFDQAGGYRGWADRLAETLAATTSPGLRYANLAVRGAQARQVHDVQLPDALAMKPDLASVAVGMNDIFRPDFDAAATAAAVDATYAALTATGCRVVTMSYPDLGSIVPVLSWLRPRQAELNARLLEAAHRHGVQVLDLVDHPVARDPLMWSHDRIHCSPRGHAWVGNAMAHLLDVPGCDPAWLAPIPAMPPRLTSWRRDARWVTTFLVPFLSMAAVGRGPASRAAAKRPELLPVRRPAVREPVPTSLAG